MSDSPDLPEIRRPSWIDNVKQIRFPELFAKYRARIVHSDNQLPFAPTRRPAPLTIEQLAFETGWGLRLALRVFLPGCLVLFAISFAWDFEGILRACSVAGCIGFGTNWVAIKMLFWPREPRPVFGQGLIPSQRDQLVQKVADQVLGKLINEELITQKIEETRVIPRFTQGLINKMNDLVQEEEFQRDLRNMVLTYVGEVAGNPEFRKGLAQRAEKNLEEFAGESFKSWLVKKLKRTWRAPLLELLNREIEDLDETLRSGLSEFRDALGHLPRALETHQEQIDRVLSQMLLGMVREVDLREIVLEQLATVTPQELEQGFREFSDDKLSFITILGGVLGLVGGTILVWPVASTLVLAGLFALLVVADLALYPLTRGRSWPGEGNKETPRAAAEAPEAPDPPPEVPPAT
jgi:uncharacterized membrane protein YheB (UPF0754 family)